MNSYRIAQLIAGAAIEKKAHDVVLMDMREITPVVDYHIVCDAPNKRQAQAIAENIDDIMSKNGIPPLRIEGHGEGRWVLLDFGDCAAHVFHADERKFYNIEQLWNDAKIEHIN